MPVTISRIARLSALSVGMLASGLAVAEARIDPELTRLLASTPATEDLQVIISYEQSGPVTAAQIAAFPAGQHARTLGFHPRYGFRAIWDGANPDDRHLPCSPALSVVHRELFVGDSVG